MNCNNCNQCDPCQKKECGSPCGCAEPVFSQEAMPDDPTVVRSNVNGKSVWYDFYPVIKAGETATTVSLDAVARALIHHGERSTQTITARELGDILHLADLGDVDANTIDNFGILTYQNESDCPEGCEGTDRGWVAKNPIENATTNLNYIMGTDAEGKLQALMPPTDATRHWLLGWDAQNKAKWTTPTIVSTPPKNDDGTVTRLYLDEKTGAIVAVREKA